MPTSFNLMIQYLRKSRFLTIFLGLTVFISLSILLRGGSQFYESGIYIDYAKSFLNDLDFNLINQVPKDMGWIVSSSYYYPDFHPEVQTPFLVLFRFFEQFATGLFYFSEEYLFSAITLNFFVLFISMKLSKKLLQEYFNIEDQLVFLPFILGTTLLYFCFFTTTVTDCFSIPLLFYILLQHIRLHKERPCDSPFIYGIALGFFTGLKIIYVPLALYLLLRAISFKRINKLFLLIGFTLPIIAKSLNTKVKFGSFFMEPHIGAKVLFDYSPSHILNKLTIGFFSQDGFFFLNPMLFIGLVCALIMLYHLYKEDKYSKLDSIVFFLWLGIVFLHPIFMLGNFIEDQLPGRATLISLPFICLGVAYVFHKTNAKSFLRGLLWATVLWNIWVVVNFVIIDSFNLNLYYLDKFITEITNFDSVPYISNLFQSNLRSLTFALPSLLIFSFVISIFASILEKVKHLTIFREHLFKYWILIFSIMTIHNIVFGPINASKMKSEGQYAGKVIGDGADVFLYDFLLDRFHSIDVESKGAMREELSRRAKLYYLQIQPQILKSTPQFDTYIKENRWNSSYFQSQKTQ